MNIGFLTNCLVKKGLDSFDDIASWAVQNGFEDLEVGPFVPLDEELYNNVMKKHNIKISAITYCRNYLSSNEEEAQEHIAQLKKRIEFAGELGIEKIVTSTGIDKTVQEGIYDSADSIRKTPIYSLDKFEKVFTPLVKLAGEKGVKLAFENCPLMGNIAISPTMWEEIFKRFDEPNIGLTYDPSHLVWQMIDPYEYISLFKNRIFHVHAKDTIVDRKRLSKCGFLTDLSWYRYTIPGHGEIDWRRLINKLNEIDFNGTISIEHEDKYYESNLMQMQKGLVLGRNYLKEFF